MKLKAVMDQDGEIKITEQSNEIQIVDAGRSLGLVWTSIPNTDGVWIIGVTTRDTTLYEMLVGIGAKPDDYDIELPLTDEQTKIILGYLAL